MMSLLEVVGLRKRYGSTIALDDVSLTVKDGSIVGLLGPNGAGKTTLMKAIVGLISADAGEIRLRQDAGVTIGALIERPGFYPYLSARRNLEALGLTAGISRSALESEVASVLERVGLARAADRRAGELSTGMKQRLGFAAALLGSPRLLVLDEPVSGLDPAGVAAMRRLMLELRAEDRTMLVSSHLLAEVEHVCDQIVIIDRGRVRASGPIADIATATPTWRLRFRADEEARRAAALLDRYFAASVIGGEVRATPRNGSAVLPLDIVTSAGLVPKEAVYEQQSLEDAYLALVEGRPTEAGG